MILCTFCAVAKCHWAPHRWVYFCSSFWSKGTPEFTLESNTTCCFRYRSPGTVISSAYSRPLVVSPVWCFSAFWAPPLPSATPEFSSTHCTGFRTAAVATGYATLLWTGLSRPCGLLSSCLCCPSFIQIPLWTITATSHTACILTHSLCRFKWKMISCFTSGPSTRLLFESRQGLSLWWSRVAWSPLTTKSTCNFTGCPWLCFLACALALSTHKCKSLAWLCTEACAWIAKAVHGLRGGWTISFLGYR